MRSHSRRLASWVMLTGVGLAVLGAAPSGVARADAPCLQPPVELKRFRAPHEPVRISLTTCAGTPHGPAVEALSLLARDKRLPRPTGDAIRAHRAAHPESAEVAPGVLRLDPELLVRLQALATRFEGHALIVVSGHRPHARPTSRHRVGRALDIAVEGVDRTAVAGFLRRLPATGVGYYPNSTFTHVDVRTTRTYWVDHSGPGERPRYSEVTVDEAPAAATVAARTNTRAAPPPQQRRAAEAAFAATPTTAAPTTAAPTPAASRPAATTAVSPAPAAPEPTPRAPARPLPPAQDDEVDWTLPYWATADRRLRAPR